MRNRPIIYIVDDDATLREVVRSYLEKEGFIVEEIATGNGVVPALEQQTPDLILLDIMLPGLDGFTITRSLRLRTNGVTAQDIPIILLTSRSDEADRVLGFELGADDYVTKPFSPRELVGRVKAVLRRTRGLALPSTGALQFGDLVIDPATRQVHVDGGELDLTVTEFSLLLLFAQHPQQVFTRQQLLDKVWGVDFYGNESTVTVHIRRLREKIERNPSNPMFIQTVWGVGYRFVPSSS